MNGSLGCLPAHSILSIPQHIAQRGLDRDMELRPVNICIYVCRSVFDGSDIQISQGTI